MCIVKMVNDPYNNESSIFNLIHYALTDKQTGKTVRYCGGYNVEFCRASEQMVLVKQYFNKWDGRKMRHLIVSFDEDITAYDAYVLGWQIAAYYGNRYQIVFGVHEDTENTHIHFVFNTVSFVDGLKYSGAKGDMTNLTAYANSVLNKRISMKI